MKKIAVNKSEVDTVIRELTKRMSEINWFVSIQTKPPTDKLLKGYEKKWKM